MVTPLAPVEVVAVVDAAPPLADDMDAAVSALVPPDCLDFRDDPALVATLTDG